MTVRSFGHGATSAGINTFSPSSDPFSAANSEVPLSVKAASELRKAEQSLASRLPAQRAGESFQERLMQRLSGETRSLRLYDSLIHKCEAERRAQLPLIELWIMRNEKDEHVQLIQDCMRRMQMFRLTRLSELDASLMASQILNDPHSSMTECLEIMLCIEMREHACWELQTNLNTLHGLPDMTERFNYALGQKSSHLGRVRSRYEDAVSRQVA